MMTNNIKVTIVHRAGESFLLRPLNFVSRRFVTLVKSKQLYRR